MARGSVGSALVVPLVVGMLGGLVGCETTSASVMPNGESLEARGRVETIPMYWSDASGRWVPEHDAFIFDGHFQGINKIDELDFYHIAGDQEAEKKIVDWRSARNRAYMIGWGVSGLGVAVLGGGAALFAVRGAENPEGYVASPEGQAAMGMMMGGGLALGMAYFVSGFFLPKESTDEWGNLLSYERATQAAADYNAKLSGGGGTQEAPAP